VDASANRIVLRPRFFDRECVVLLLLPALGALVLAGMVLTTTARTETVHCDRAANLCTYFFPGPFNGNTYMDALASWKSSHVVTRKSGTTWEVERGTTPLWLGSDATRGSSSSCCSVRCAPSMGSGGGAAGTPSSTSIPRRARSRSIAVRCSSPARAG
jgi:hypothetical protein